MLSRKLWKLGESTHPPLIFGCRPRHAFARALATMGVGLALAVLGPARAAEPIAFSSRLLAPDPEWQAMRGARAATGLGIAAALGNPAAISALNGPSAACSHLQYAGDLSREWAGAGWPLGHGATLAVDAATLHGPELPGYDANGAATTPFRATEWNAGLQAAMLLGERFSAGFGARLFRLEDPTEPLSGAGFSLGLQVRGCSRTAGIALTDVGARLRGSQRTYALPTRWRAGFEQAISDRHLLVAASMEGETAGGTRGALGVAVRPVGSLELMGGLLAGSHTSGDASIGWSAGVKVNLFPIAVSYAFQQEGALGNTYLIGIQLDRRRTGLPQGKGVTASRQEPAPPASSGITDSEPPAPAEMPSPPATVNPGYAVLGGIYGSAAAGRSELALIQRAGFAGARIFRENDGRWRVLVLECPAPDQAQKAALSLRARAILVTAEHLETALPPAGSPDSP